ncbi:carbonic anhydrase, partial [Streptomyces fradiae]|uniref:carbonic anhydrase n=1 Tax=Streptomyces fradiae TaxID=1906 RepID=UPI0036ACAE45
MQPLIDNARTFGQRPEEFAKLAEGQSPEVLFITCSDSRVVPALITGARPGQLFELRTAGNIVPPYTSGRPTGEAATIEYAVEVLGVRDVVVCGHSHCGAVGALVRGDDLSAVPAVREWLAHAAPEPTPGRPHDPAGARPGEHPL